MDDSSKLTRTELKRVAQDELMHGIGNVLGYWRENPPEIMDGATDAAQDDFAAILKREADRVARFFGYDEAWSN